MTLLAIQNAFAEDAFPSRTIKLVVSYGAGGSLDAMARVLATELGKLVEQPVVVENIAGAGGTLGVRRVVDAAPDGYTLLMGVTSDVALAPSSNPTVKYRAGDLQAVAKVGTSGIVMIGRPGLTANTLAELIGLARSQPGTLRYGTSGAGSLQHLAMETLKLKTGVNIPFIPYKSATQVVADVIGGHLDLGVVGLPAVLPHISGGKVKAFAILSRQRDAGNRNIPAAAEMPALQALDFNLWTGIFAPRGTPTLIVDKLNASIAAALSRPELVEKYSQMGVEIAAPATSQQFSQYVAAEERKLRVAYERSGIKEH
ncbi:tripartite tricarboxylate transporter substrate binding protein [Cupriavidus basilensis]|uniref:Tripartite tricarboxylate transporter substrate binding protein n=1 Tax=Cupriavidus basilensis TaxID=68895 RepID=A0ABT6AHC9_9BURK|nr:tripartite tricarboxylate transporter substrate binding protein [Cupriavidus basilensis]MDF3831732.1 tripartite tricarboxylate transporter substrate binding protein [Cupriavidus basilensis]